MKLITIKQLADMAGVSRSTIYNWLASNPEGMPTPHKMGDSQNSPVRFDQEEAESCFRTFARSPEMDV